VPEALLVVDGDDPGAVLLAAALRRHGWRLHHLDLRYGRPTLDGSGAEPVVVVDGGEVRPDLVLNRTATSRLGLAPGSALARQLPATWWGRHLAAREEQGLLLACFDLWERTSRLYDPVATGDRRLLRPAVAAELHAAGLPLVAAGGDGHGDGHGDDGRRGAAWIVDGVVVAAATQVAGQPWRATPLSPATEDVLRRTATIAGLRLGQLDLWQTRSGGTAVTGWQPIPGFRAVEQRTEIPVAALVVAALVDPGRAPEPVAAPPFLAADLEANVLRVSSQGLPG
jgi:hypothetical protein